ncbi:hypothetical protein Syun_009858 [Stephania yunnanensis]|uniref:Uncharacterized protein n=1 Tax=Stephania yunnanensis TaxID=152371 RepID=A0AAP0KH84_9MAGN
MRIPKTSPLFFLKFRIHVTSTDVFIHVVFLPPPQHPPYTEICTSKSQTNITHQQFDEMPQ